MVLGLANIIIQYKYIKEYNKKIKYQRNINNKYKLSKEELLSLKNERKLDILDRGDNQLVYNLNGNTVKLKDADLWHNNGKYVKPEISRINYCIY